MIGKETLHKISIVGNVTVFRHHFFFLFRLYVHEKQQQFHMEDKIWYDTDYDSHTAVQRSCTFFQWQIETRVHMFSVSFVVRNALRN